MESEGMLLGMLLGAAILAGGVYLGTWLARQAQADRAELENQLGQAIAEQQHEIMRLRSNRDASGEDLGL